MSFIGRGLVSLMRNTPGRLHANQSKFCLRSVVRHRTTNDNGGMLASPFSMRFGLPKVVAVVVPFLYFGATISKEGAAFLEEYDIFVPEDDD